MTEQGAEEYFSPVGPHRMYSIITVTVLYNINQWFSDVSTLPRLCDHSPLEVISQTFTMVIYEALY